MCRKLIYLVSFVCMLGLVSAAMADDLDPPYWCGGPDSSWAIWTFDEEATEEGMGVFHAEIYEGDPERHVVEGSLWDEEGTGGEEMAAFNTWGGEIGWEPEYEGRQGVATEVWEMVGMINNWPRDEERFKRIRIQMTFFGPPDTFVECETICAEWGGEGWNFWPGELWLDWMEMEYGEWEFIYTELDDGWFHVMMEVDTQYILGTEDFPINPGAEVFFVGGEGIYIDQVIVDTICYSGDEPPGGPGRVKRVKVVQVSNEQPEDGEEHVDPYDPNILCFQAPADAICLYDPCEDPNAGPPDPNFKGPFEYDVYFGTEPNVLTMTQLASAYTPAECNDVMCFDPCDGDLNPGTEYFWRVDTNDLNEPPGDDPCFYEGPFFSFTTWGFATDPVPADGEEDVDTGTVQLKWTGDGFVGAAGTGYDIYFPDDTFIKYQDCGTADANKYTPTQSLILGEEYCWRIDEVNVVTVEGHVWCFSTSLCSTWETFEDYADRDAIVAVWVDWETNGTGSWIYLGESSDNEPVHSGDQSMEYYFDNTVGGGILYPYSESTRTFSPVDWSPESDIAPGARALRIWFHDTDEDGAGAEQMYVKLYDGTTEGRVDFDPDTSVTEEEEEYWFWDEATEEDVFALWIGWSINLSDFDVELSTIASMTIGFDTEATDGLVFFDTFQLCGTRCIPAQAPWSWNEDCATDWDELEMIQENWLAKDEWEPVKEPCDANLVVEYLFDNDDLTDTAGDANGIPVNEPNIHDGLMTLDGDDWVIVPIDASLFQGDKSWTVIMDIVADVNGVMFGVAREPYGQVGEGGVDGEGYYYDPCLCLEDANYCDEGLPPYPYGGEEGTSGLVMFQGENGIVADRFWKGGTEVEDVPPGELYQVVLVYDAEEALCLIYVDETATGEPMEFDPNVPDPCEDTVTIGHTENSFYPDEEGIFNFIGDIDNFRIYDYALSYAEILGKLYPEDIEDGEHKFPLETDSNVDEQTINYDGKDRQIIDLRDFALFAEHWLEVVLWPPEE